MYPRSLPLLGLLVQVEQRAFLVSQLRLRVRLACSQHGFVPLWMLAARLEASQVLARERLKVRPIPPKPATLANNQMIE